MKTLTQSLASTVKRSFTLTRSLELGHKLRKTGMLAFGAYLGLAISLPASAQIADKPLFLTGQGLPPNVLLIIDNSESMQEGLDGRVALDWQNCVPGAGMDPVQCPAGARYENSKGSIVKRVGRNLVNTYRGQINLGLMAYQQYPAGGTFNDALPTSNNPRTVLWRLYHRPIDVRYSRAGEQATFYDPNHNLAWNSPTKRYIERHPLRNNVFVYYNDAVPGYERSDFTEFCRKNTNFDDIADGGFGFDCHDNVNVDAQGALTWGTRVFRGTIYLVDSMRQRGIPDWGERVNYSPLNQNEWRATRSPGLGYLHVPIGGINADGSVNQAHLDGILRKLEPQRHNWTAGQGNVLVDPQWPLIAAGLTPIQGTMKTAQSYFTGSNSNFGSNQGNNSIPPIPESCGINAAVWITDGLPSVRSDGTSLGTSPVTALEEAEASIREFHEQADVDVYVVGFSLPAGVADIPGMPEDPLSKLAAAGGTGAAIDSSDEDSLNDAMSQLFERIIADSSGSAAAVAANSTSLQSGTAIFQAGFDSRDWSGELKALRVESPQNPGDSVVQNTPAWNAEERLPAHGSRNIITWVPRTGSMGQTPPAAFGDTKPFIYDELNTAQRQALGTPSISGVTDLGRKRVNWLRGSKAEEGFNATNLRTRSRLLGDIVYSRPLFVHAQNFGYQAFTEGGNSYPAFLNTLASSSPLVSVAANDGKLHFFDARLPCRAGETTGSNGCSATGGTEVFAYVPNLVIPQLSKLTSQNYNRDREYIFDGSPRLGHVYDGTNWRRIVVGSLGRGGKGAFALDVDTQEVLWEVSPTTHPEIGNVIGEPILGRAASGQWITVIPNGYGSSGGKASLIILDTLTGATLETFEPNNATVNPANGNNGMFTPIAVDLNGDRKIDRLYAGDLRGNMWRYDLGGNSGTNQWGVPNFLSQGQTQSPLFQARTSGGQIQPITARPAVVSDDRGRVVVLFGTGKYFESEDNNVSTARTQSFYGIIDDGQAVARSQLRPQEITHEVSEFGFELRATTERDITDTQRGWVMDLISPNNGFEGERVIEDAIIRPGNRVVFSTLIPQPSSDPCQPGGGTGWIMELDAFTGSRLENSPFDLSGQGFGEESFISVVIGDETVRIPPSGIRSTVGIPTRPAVIEDPQQRGREYKLPVGSQGQVMEIIEERVGSGRRSWRQLR